MPRAQKQTQVPKDFSSVAKIRKKHLRRKKKKASDFRSVAKTWRYFVAWCMCCLKRGNQLSLYYPFHVIR